MDFSFFHLVTKAKALETKAGGGPDMWGAVVANKAYLKDMI